MYDVRNYDHMDVVVCAGVGGGSLIYANVFLEPPDEVFADPRWPASCKKPELTPYYAVAKSVLGSRPIPSDVGDPRRHIHKTKLFQTIAKKATKDSKLLDINVFFGNDHAVHHRLASSPGIGSGRCKPPAPIAENVSAAATTTPKTRWT